MTTDAYVTAFQASLPGLLRAEFSHLLQDDGVQRLAIESAIAGMRHPRRPLFVFQVLWGVLFEPGQTPPRHGLKRRRRREATPSIHNQMPYQIEGAGFDLVAAQRQAGKLRRGQEMDE